jgi:hypothetical protein
LHRRRTLLVVAPALLAPPAWAHHGWSSFDQARPIYLEGTARDVRWRNPHAELRLELPAEPKLPADLATRSLPPQSALRRREGRRDPARRVRVRGRPGLRTALVAGLKVQSVAKASRAAATVASISAGECAALTNPASYSAGARYTPRSSMAWKKRLKRSLSVAITVP